MPPNTEVHYRLSVDRVHAVYVTPWVRYEPDPDLDWFWIFRRRALWSDPVTGGWHPGGGSCCAGPTWEYTATSDATGTVHGESSYRWQADPGEGWMLSHYAIAGAFVEDLDHSVRKHVHSYRIRCEQWGRVYLFEVGHDGDERPHNPVDRPSCQIEVPATGKPVDFYWA